MRHAVIMAGGSGTRLWPLSRSRRPKQLLRLFEGSSLLRLARERLRNLFDTENIWVATSEKYLDSVATALPNLPRQNLIGEPMGRDTANAIGLAAHLLHRRDPDATMAVFTADHLIEPQDAFDAAIRNGLEAAEANPEALVTFGVTPTEPHTGYGYVQVGAPVGGAYQVESFREKPDVETAREYVSSGSYLWNSGMFAWKLKAILGELERCLPTNHETLQELVREWEFLTGTPQAAERFGGLEKISIDFGVMEKARQVLTVKMDCKWLDLGSWTSLAETRDPDEHGNVSVAPRTMVVDGENNILVSEEEHLLVTLGVSDLIVVHAGDVTLVCRREDAQRVKDLVEMARNQHGDQFA